MKKILVINIGIVLLLLVTACGGEKKMNENEHGNESVENKHEHNMSNGDNTKSEYIREGIIDLVSIDENKNDSLFECPMDWNVLSDREGDCPSCGMKLNEYKISDIKDNLEKHGFEYK